MLPRVAGRPAPALEVLDLSGSSEITDAGIERLQHCRRLESLDISWLHEVGDASLVSLATLPALRRLMLVGCNITREGTETLSTFPALEWLTLPLSRSLDDDAIAWLSSIQSPLRTIAYGRNGVTPQSVQCLTKLDSLENIMLGAYDGNYRWHEFASVLPSTVDLTFA